MSFLLSAHLRIYLTIIINYVHIHGVVGNAYIMSPPKNVTAKEGSRRVELTCQAEGYPNNITYQWFKNDVDVSLVPNLLSRAAVYADGDFVINNLERDDYGWYKCRPSNGLGVPPEASAYLNVTYSPRVLGLPRQLYLPKGMLGKIDCPTDANPPVTVVVWTKNDSTLDYSTNRLKNNKQGTLVIKSVTEEDAGIYKCTPYSALGAGPVSSPLEVIVKDPPHFIVRPAPFYQKVQEDSVTMPCMVAGEPEPRITWQKVDGNFPPARRTLIDVDGNLTIVNLVKEDHGTYECIATNPVTRIITSTMLLFELSSPHAAYNLSVEVEEYKATLRWMPAYDGGQPQHYVLWYKTMMASEEWNTMRVQPDGALFATVHRLHSDTIYQFMVLSRSRDGEGQFSNVVTAKTLGSNDGSLPTASPSTSFTSGFEIGMDYHGLPNDERNLPRNFSKIQPSPPHNVTARQTEDGALYISWLPPRLSPAPIAYYVVQYRTVGLWVNLTGAIPGSQIHYTWETVSRGATYHFRVCSFSSSGIESNPSVSIEYVTGDPMNDGMKVSTLMIGGVFGGLFLIVVVLILAVFIFRYCKRYTERRKHRFGNVKYSGPNHVEENSIKNNQ